MKSKKRKVKNSPEKRYQNASRAIVRTNHLVAVRLESQIEDKFNTHLFDYKTCKKRKPNSLIIKAVTSVKYKWSIWYGVYCLDQFGKPYTQGEWILAKEPYYHQNLAETVADSLSVVVNNANGKQVKDVGWIAVPEGIELDDETVMKIIENYRE